LGSGWELRWEEHKPYPKPFGLHLYMLHFMGLEIIQDDNIVNCINYYDSLFSGGRELEKGKNEPSPFGERVLYEIVRKTVL